MGCTKKKGMKVFNKIGYAFEKLKCIKETAMAQAFLPRRRAQATPTLLSIPSNSFTSKFTT